MRKDFPCASVATRHTAPTSQLRLRPSHRSSNNSPLNSKPGPSNWTATRPPLHNWSPQIHLTFGQRADQLVASLLAHAAQQPALADAAKKK